MSSVWIIPLLPFLGFLINAFVGKRLGKNGVRAVACGVLLFAFAASLGAVGPVLFGGSMPEGDNIVVNEAGHAYEVTVWEWIPAGERRGVSIDGGGGFLTELNIPFGFYIDPLTAVMLLVVTGVGFLIHLYASKYMDDEDEAGYARFFTYLNLFVAMMLILIMGSTFVTMFVGWEGVGLCSYLLIGFYYKKEKPPVAGMKAFLVNRIGDFGFLLGMLLLLLVFGSLRYTEVFERAAASPGFAGSGIALAIALLLFVGATGKSAQLPLYTWLPDAMEGPTPVSALIHAATMVTAGVFMIIRSNVLFQASVEASMVVAIVGGLTAFFAATIALVQNDLKKILAYSTVSQLGYMFLAVGCGAYTAGLFHLVTHAFFKALLFLGAGSVSHAMHHELDIRKMGGLKSVLPQTRLQMFIACLAIAGVPILAGFWSKDEILLGALAQGTFPGLAKALLYGGGLLTAVMTAFYMFRLYYRTFEGEPRWDDHQEPHEAPTLMTGPLWVLAGLSAVGGFIGFGAWTHLPNWLHHALEPVLHPGQLVAATAHFGLGTELVLVAAATAAALVGWFWARTWYGAENEAPARMARRFPKLHALASAKWRVDEIYDALFVTPFRRACEWAGTFDRWVVDGLVEGAGVGATLTGEVLRHVSSGRVRTYALSVFIGAVGVAVWLIVH